MSSAKTKKGTRLNKRANKKGLLEDPYLSIEFTK